MEEVKPNKKEWEEILSQNIQFSKNYYVNWLISQKAIELIKEEIAKFPDAHLMEGGLSPEGGESDDETPPSTMAGVG